MSESAVFQRRPIEESAIFPLIEYQRAEIKRLEQHYGQKMQRGHIKPETVEFITRKPRAILAKLEALYTAETGCKA